MDHWPILVLLNKPDGPRKECKKALNDLKILLISPGNSRRTKLLEPVNWATRKKGKAENQLAILRQHKTAFLESLEVSDALV